MKYTKKYRVQIEVDLKADRELTPQMIKEQLYLYPGHDDIYDPKGKEGSQLIPASWGKFDVRVKEVK